MLTKNVDGFRFTFLDSWQVTKYDDWSFYKNQFAKMNDGIKAVDIAACDGECTLWLIEVKNFRQYGRQSTTPLHEEVWKKVYDTLAGLFAAKCNAVNEEQAFAQRAAQVCKVRVILHLEQPTPSSRLYQERLCSADISQKLRKKLKSIDPHPLVVSKTTMPPSLQWSVN